MRLGLIGRGPWGEVYARTLRGMGVEFWRAGREWNYEPRPFVADGVIIAAAPAYHAEIAEAMIGIDVPIIIEKPLCLNAEEARALLDDADHSIVFVAHTRLYSTAWREFKAKALAQGVRSVRAAAGGSCKIAPHWDWGSHLVAMCFDLGFDPLAADITTSREERPLTFIVNDELVYRDPPLETPTPMEVLLTEFMTAIKKGDPDIRGLELGVKVVEALEEMTQREKAWL